MYMFGYINLKSSHLKGLLLKLCTYYILLYVI
nr:MAG TPA: hypothetical protein [Caudoviricetes sp.]